MTRPLQVQSINVAYGEIQALWDVSFEASAGEIICIVGANGAGKTTLVRAISGILHPRDGKIAYEGEDITHMATYDILARGIVHVPEGRQLFHDMTVLENLELGAFSKEAKKQFRRSLSKVFVMFPRLEERKYQAAGTLSGGEQQMLAIGRGLMSVPKCIMFDEPSLGIAPNLVEQILAVVQQIAREGITVILVEQEVKKALKISNHGYVIESGRLVMGGKSQELLANPEFQRAYLGL
ncbi:MAG: ABC transporter ATP-binding protein [Candidatus Korobacteraceae bacterium]